MLVLLDGIAMVSMCRLLSSEQNCFMQLEQYLTSMRPSRRRSKNIEKSGPVRQMSNAAGNLKDSHTEAELAIQLQSSSKGGQMLRALGWQEGQGIGARGQGMLDPIIPRRRKHLLGLGAE